MHSLFLKGLIIGFAIAAPVGPIGVLCIQRSLHNGFKVGFRIHYKGQPIKHSELVSVDDDLLLYLTKNLTP